MYYLFLIIFLFFAISLVALVMLQQGKGYEVGSTLKTGVSSTFFSSGGYSNFITYMTTIFATVFFILSLVLCTMSSNFSKNLEIKLNKYQQTKKVSIEK